MAKARLGLICSGVMGSASDGTGDGTFALRVLVRGGRVELPGLVEREEEREPAFSRLGRSIGQPE
jgi:hypothetical protein